MSTTPEVILGERFTAMHERFEINTPAIAEVLGRIGLQDQEVSDFTIKFEDRFVISLMSRFLFNSLAIQGPGTGWTTRGENGIHVTGLDDWQLPVHPSPETYGHTILHELGHIDYMRRKPTAPDRIRKEERVAERFAQKNARLIPDLVEYELNLDAVHEATANLHPDDATLKAMLNEKYQKEADRMIAKAPKQ